MTEDDYEAKRIELGDEFQAKMGAEGIRDLLETIEILIWRLKNSVTT
jgi:DNA-directed RNA polymerase subunit beta'